MEGDAEENYDLDERVETIPMPPDPNLDGFDLPHVVSSYAGVKSVLDEFIE